MTFLRDTVNRRSDLTLQQLRAMGASAVEHTRHLIGIGLIRADQATVWWKDPESLGASERAELSQALTQRTQRRGIWRVPSTYLVIPRSNRALLVMMEPIQAPTMRTSAIVGVFDLKPLVEDFFTSGVSQHWPVQLLSPEGVLYTSDDWEPLTTDHRPIIVQSPLAIDSARWTLQMQPGHTRVTQTLSWFNVLLVALSILAGVGVIIIVWILAARTWILQRAVTRRTAALRRTSERLRQMAITDDLTGLYNRRFFLDRWEWECERARRYQRPLACLMIDVNGFKQVNDRLGHAAGDLVLKQIARELKTLLRQSDILARFGGDEFIIALPETDLEQAKAVADKLRHVEIPVQEGEGRNDSTISLSVGLGRADHDQDQPEQILEAADQALYAQKRQLKALSARSA